MEERSGEDTVGEKGWKRRWQRVGCDDEHAVPCDVERSLTVVYSRVSFFSKQHAERSTSLALGERERTREEDKHTHEGKGEFTAPREEESASTNGERERGRALGGKIRANSEGRERRVSQLTVAYR